MPLPPSAPDDILAAAAQIDPPLLASIPPGMLTAALDGAAGDDIAEDSHGRRVRGPERHQS